MRGGWFVFIFPCFLPGLALNYIFENSFKPEAGARTGVSKIGILITDGKSQDDIIPPSRNLRESGVELFAIGMCYVWFCFNNGHRYTAT